MSINVVEGFLKGRVFTLYDDKNLVGLNEEAKIIKIPLTSIASVVKKEELKDITFYDITFTDYRKITASSTKKIYERLYKAQFEGNRTSFSAERVNMKPTIIKLAVLVMMILSIIMMFKCSGSNNSGDVAEPQPAVTNPAPAVASFSDEELCKAVIASQFSKPVKIISVYQHTGNEIRVRYKRKEDKTVWKYKCKVDGNTIIWGAIDPDRVGDEQAGRWRTRYSEGDDEITYTVQNEDLHLTITSQYSGTSSTQAFHKSDFAKANKH